MAMPGNNPTSDRRPLLGAVGRECAAILNWRVERINGRNITTMVVLFEGTGAPPMVKQDDPFITVAREQIPCPS